MAANSPKIPEKKIWTREEIKKLIQENDKALARAVVVIYGRQTTDEQYSAETKHQNGRGFTGADAYILSSFAQQIEQHIETGKLPLLSPKQFKLARRKMSKYAGQLELVAKETAAKGGDAVA